MKRTNPFKKIPQICIQMKVLSFDIGLKNMAYCVVEDTTLVKWQTLDISGEKDFNATSKKLLGMLHDEFPDPIYDFVLIENQPVLKNPIMKSVQMLVYSYFQIYAYQHGSNCDVRLIAAGSKLKVRQKPKLDTDGVINKTGYKNNKLKAILYTQHYLTGQEPKWTEDFSNNKKKDDIADAFCSAVQFLESRGKVFTTS